MNEQSRIPGWLRDAAGAPIARPPAGQTPDPTPTKGSRWKAVLRWLAERLLAER
jgi:hypothetical protein